MSRTSTYHSAMDWVELNLSLSLVPYSKHECGISWNKWRQTKLWLPKEKPPQPSTIMVPPLRFDITNINQSSLYTSFLGLQELVTQPQLSRALACLSNLALGTSSSTYQGLQIIFPNLGLSTNDSTQVVLGLPECLFQPITIRNMSTNQKND